MGHQYATLLRGSAKSSICMTDGYKFSMAQAGFPLRSETFHLVLRQGGPHFLPFDFSEVAQDLFQNIEYPLSGVDFLTRQGYALTQAMIQAFVEGQCEAWSPPAGSWVGNGAPVLTVSGPSFKVSWLEPLAIMFRFPIQVATAAMNGVTEFRCTCEAEMKIVHLVLDALGKTGCTVTTSTPDYIAAVTTNVTDIKDALGGEIERAFEVGMRAATCMDMHTAALVACIEHGLVKTSNVHLAHRLSMRAVGTTGHEHQQRWFSDGAGFRAMRDMRTVPPTYLFDTYDTLTGGIPAAVEVMREDLNRPCFVRFDSGDQDEQLRRFLIAEGHYGTKPGYIFEDSYTAAKTEANEYLCTQDVTKGGFGLDRARLFYGYGGFIVNPKSCTQFRRDDVGAVYKLSQTGGVPVMKDCGTKSSLPGKPCILVDDQGNQVIAQQGEILERCHPLTAADPRPTKWVPAISPLTAEFRSQCRGRNRGAR